ncbi:hypothetical protein F4781DRAFT_137491 [Annulohypoxylon bovei var. microspora]|nr:hypothetical protein F4781DRAFT_137491 [Annulohypoxylon bovei var. microspora]
MDWIIARAAHAAHMPLMEMVVMVLWCYAYRCVYRCVYRCEYRCEYRLCLRARVYVQLFVMCTYIPSCCVYINTSISSCMCRCVIDASWYLVISSPNYHEYHYPERQLRQPPGSLGWPETDPPLVRHIRSMGHG